MTKLTANKLLNTTSYGVMVTKSYSFAVRMANAGKMITSILLGENDTYIVAPTLRLESILINAGYEAE